MPLQNRVAPDQTLNAVPHRGTLMGNRGGRFHNGDQSLGKKHWFSKAWISCLLDFNDRPPRPVMADGYTELFFLDEPTALASGHRPCFQCRYKAAMRFAELFSNGPKRAYVAEMDKILHQERMDPPDIEKPNTLPDGTLFKHSDAFYLIKENKALKWTHKGYQPPEPLPTMPVEVLTPSCVRSVLSAGYAPFYHPSALAQA